MLPSRPKGVLLKENGAEPNRSDMVPSVKGPNECAWADAPLFKACAVVMVMGSMRPEKMSPDIPITRLVQVSMVAAPEIDEGSFFSVIEFEHKFCFVFWLQPAKPR